MGKEKGKPGVMMYFDLMRAYELLTYEQMGRLFMGIFRYAYDGTEPEDLDMQTELMWTVMQPNIDRDDENYYKKVENARRSVEKREARRKKINDILAESATLAPAVRRVLQEATAPEDITEIYASVSERNQQQPPQQPQEQTQEQSQFERQRQKQIQRLKQSEY